MNHEIPDPAGHCGKKGPTIEATLFTVCTLKFKSKREFEQGIYQVMSFVQRREKPSSIV